MVLNILSTWLHCNKFDLAHLLDMPGASGTMACNQQQAGQADPKAGDVEEAVKLPLLALTISCCLAESSAICPESFD